MALTDLTRISTAGIATGSTIDSPILRKDVDFRGDQVGVGSALFDSSERRLDFKDNVKLRFGDSGDLQLQHNGSDSVISQSAAGTGNLKILSGGAQSIECVQAGAVNIAHNGNTKIATTSTGAIVTGILTATTFSGKISGDTTGNIYAASGISTVYNLRVSNDLTVEGTTTTLDTNLIGVDRIEVGANSNSIVGVAITQSGTADIFNLYDGATEVFSVADGGAITATGTITASDHIKIVDDKQLTLGTDDNLYIKHSDGHSNNFVVSSIGDIEHHMASSKKIIKGFNNSGDPYVNLYYSNGIRLTTTDAGITVTGKVGIGVTNPTAKIQIKGAGGTTGLGVLTTDASGNNVFWTHDGGRVGLHYNPLVINQDIDDTDCPSGTYFYVHHASHPFIIKNDGKVGVGKTDPDGKLDVLASRTTAYGTTNDQRSLAHIVARNASDAATRFASISLVSGGGTQAEGSINLVQTGNYKGDLTFKSRTGSSSWTEKLRILADGEVLIGGRSAWGSNQHPNDANKVVITGPTPSDTYRNILMLEGSETDGSADTGGSLAFGGHDGNNNRNWANIWGMKENGTGGNTAGYMAFHTRPAGGNPTERLRIASDGDVGIGTHTVLDDTKVHIYDTSTSNYRSLAIESFATSGSTLIYKQNGSQVLAVGSGGGNVLSGSNVTHGLIRSEVATVFAVGNSERLRIASDSNITQTIDTDGDGFIITTGSADIKPMLTGNSNRGAENNTIFGISGKWNNTEVGRIAFEAGADTTNKDDGNINLYTRVSGGSLTSKLNIKSGGDVEITDGNLLLASGHGVNFQASGTGSGTTVNSHVLDDYERGTFVLKIYYGTGTDEPSYSWRYAHYIKVGKQVTIWFNVGITGFSPTNTEGVYIANLPFQNNDPNSQWKYLNLMYGYSWASGWGFNSNTNNQMFLALYDNETRVRLVKHDGAYVYTNDIGSGQRFSSYFSYQTDS